MSLLNFILAISIIIIMLSLYEIFLEDYIKNLKPRFKKLYQKSHGVEFVRIKIKKGKGDKEVIDISKESIDNYFNLINKYLSKAQKSIKVVDYFSSKNVIRGLYDSNYEHSDEQADYLKAKYKEYYTNLKDIFLNNEKIEYTRISQISGMYRNEDLDPLDKRAEKAISLMTPTLTFHLFDILKTKQDRFKFYICNAPAVLYNYMIIDDKYVLSEYPFYSPEGITFPDEMYVNRKSSLSNQLEKRKKLFEVLMRGKTNVNFELLSNAYAIFLGVVTKEKNENKKYNEDYEEVSELIGIK